MADKTGISDAEQRGDAAGAAGDTVADWGDDISPTARFLSRCALCASVVCVVGYVVIGLMRLGYPYELEWMEGGCVDIALRIRAGQPVYVEPGIAYAPFVYPPLYYWLVAQVMGVAGEGFLAGRLVSYASTLGVMALIFSLARRETGGVRAGLLSAALYAASFEVTGLWFDVVRVDNLALFFVVAGWRALRMGRGMAAGAVAGLLFGLGALTKQTCMIPAFCMAAGLALSDRRSAAAFCAVFAAVFGGISMWLNSVSHGWYGFYVFDLPRSHELFGFAFHHFWRQDIFWNYTVAFLCAAYLIVDLWNSRSAGESSQNVARAGVKPVPVRDAVNSGGMPSRIFYPAALAGALLSAWTGRVRSGGGTNALLPAAAAISLLYGPAFYRLLANIRNIGEGVLPLQQEEQGQPAIRQKSSIPSPFFTLAWGAALAQFFVLIFDPGTYLFSVTDERIAENYIRLLGSYEGEVFAPWHGYLPRKAGKQPNGHWMALYDVVRSSGEKTRPAREKLMREIDGAIADGRFDAIIADADGYAEIEELVVKRHPGVYRMREGVPICSPVAGPKCRVVYVLERTAENRKK
ncbi:MAG TPA: glycosyltransferase family 39 protein [Candidatus Brocadiia bacterium]|nr:glycosyltransferase family 39 protein [Candidatus Brocadiia bacterium]